MISICLPMFAKHFLIFAYFPTLQSGVVRFKVKSAPPPPPSPSPVALETTDIPDR